MPLDSIHFLHDDDDSGVEGLCNDEQNATRCNSGGFDEKCVA